MKFYLMLGFQIKTVLHATENWRNPTIKCSDDRMNRSGNSPWYLEKSAKTLNKTWKNVYNKNFISIFYTKIQNKLLLKEEPQAVICS